MLRCTGMMTCLSKAARCVPAMSSTGLHGGNQPVQWEQKPPEAAGGAAAARERRGQADEGPGLAAGGQPAVAQPLPPDRSQVRTATSIPEAERRHRVAPLHVCFMYVTCMCAYFLWENSEGKQTIVDFSTAITKRAFRFKIIACLCGYLLSTTL